MRIAVLDCSTASDPSLEAFGSVGDMVVGWLSPHLPEADFRIVAVTEGETLPEAGDADGFVLPGSGCGVHDDVPWMAPLAALLRDARAASEPVLGICFGHQLMAQTFGGRSVQTRDGLRGGVRRWALNDAQGDETFDAYALHSDQVVETAPGSRVLGGARYCPVGVVAYDDFPGLSTQFHPEYGSDYVAAMIDTLDGSEMTAAEAARARRSLARPVRADLFGARAAALFRDRRTESCASPSST